MLNNYYNIFKNKLFPINRSITGHGTEKTLEILKTIHPELEIKYFKSGTKVFDWTIPPEWIVSEAYIKDKFNKKIIDFKNNNLHLIGYSEKIKKKIKKIDLLKKIYVSKKFNDAIPYVTSYYEKNWGFCASKNKKEEIKKKYKNNDFFKVFIDSKFKKNGRMPYGELLIKGKSKKEILISTYICHPSMANNELSGPLLSILLINYYKKKNNSKTIRFIFIPETIGSIAYIAKNLKKFKNIIGAYNLSCVGDNRGYSCMLSKNQDAISDHALINSLKSLKIKYKSYSFLKRGSDERQFNWPGIDMAMTSFFRTKYGEYPEYHTSKDTFENVLTKKGIQGSLKVMKDTINYIQDSVYPISSTLCEPKMDKRGLYSYLSFEGTKVKYQRKFLDFLIYSDGKNNLNQISKKINLDIKKTKKIFKIMLYKKLIKI